MWLYTKNTLIKYHHFQSLSQKVTYWSNKFTPRNRSHIFLQRLWILLLHLCYKLNGCQDSGILLSKEIWEYTRGLGILEYLMKRGWDKNLIWNVRDQCVNLFHDLISRPKDAQSPKSMSICLYWACMESL